MKMDRIPYRWWLLTIFLIGAVLFWRFGGDFSGAGFTQYLAGMALQAAAKLPGADPAWRTAAAQTAPFVPSEIQMAQFNRHLARPNAFPARWADAGGAVTIAAIQMLQR